MKLRLNINQNVSIISAISSQIHVISGTHHLRLQPTIILIDYCVINCQRIETHVHPRRAGWKSKDEQFIKIQNEKKQQICSSEQLEQILVCSVGVLIVWLTCCFSWLRRVLPHHALWLLKSAEMLKHFNESSTEPKCNMAAERVVLQTFYWSTVNR